MRRSDDLSDERQCGGSNCRGGDLHCLLGATEHCFTSRAGGRLLLVGGPPFPEKILMWWNFVARTPQEIADARTDWEERRRFGEVTGYSGPTSRSAEPRQVCDPNPAS